MISESKTFKITNDSAEVSKLKNCTTIEFADPIEEEIYEKFK